MYVWNVVGWVGLLKVVVDIFILVYKDELFLSSKIPQIFLG
jgi:hypothetical protein